MKAAITGATGLLGSVLTKQLDDPIILSRNPEKARAALGVSQAYRWDPNTEPAPAEAFKSADVVFHVAGESVSEGRWTTEKKRRIRDSRISGTRHLVETLTALPQKPTVLVSASAVGYYGSRGDEKLPESAAPGEEFLAQICVDWEREAKQAENAGIRVVNLRIGIVLTPAGGALHRMLLPFKMGVGGKLGNGKQWMPWVHIDDVIGLFLHAARSNTLRGPVNVVAPGTVTNKDFTKTLARELGRPAIIPVPKQALSVAFGEMSQIILASHRVVPEVAESTGYTFQYPDLRGALNHLLSKPSKDS